MRRIALSALCLLAILAGCEKKAAEVVPRGAWTGSVEVGGIPLSGTVTVYSDKSFVLDAAVTVLGVGMDFSKVGLGSFQGDPASDGELTFVLEELAPDIMPLLESAGILSVSLPLTVDASIQGDSLVLADIGVGQEISLKREEVQ